MPGSDLILWGDASFESPYVLSAFVALEEKGLPYELRTLALQAGEHRRGDYPSRSLTGRVPALQHGDFWLAESSAIDEYLEDAFPPPAHARLYPEGPQERARARQLQAWVRSDLLPLREERPSSSVFARAAGREAGRDPVEPLTEAGRQAAERVIRVVEGLLAPGAAHLLGAFGIVDVDLAMMLQRLIANGDPLPDRLRAYAEGVWRRPSIQRWIERARAAHG